MGKGRDAMLMMKEASLADERSSGAGDDLLRKRKTKENERKRGYPGAGKQAREEEDRICFLVHFC